MFLIVSILIGYWLASPAARGANTDAFLIDGKPPVDLAQENPQLKKDLWGWTITNYGGPDAYLINGRTYLLLESSIRSDGSGGDAFLWDPITGFGWHLDSKQSWNFFSKNKDKRFGSPNMPLGMEGQRRMTEVSSPGQTFSCHSVFYRYYHLTDDDGSTIRNFYVVWKRQNPRLLDYRVCSECDIPKKDTVWAQYDDTVGNYVLLMDSTVLFFNPPSDYLQIIRLDQNGRQRTTLGNRAFTLDADRINEKLNSCEVNFPAFRYGVFTDAIKAVIRDKKQVNN